MSDKRSGSGSRRGVPWWGWLLIVAVGIGLTVAFPFVALPAALAVLVISIVGWAKGKRTWLRFRSRKSAVGMSAIAMAALVLAGGSAAVAVAGASPAPQAEASTFTGTAAVQKPDAEKSTPAPRPARTVKAAPSATPTPTPEDREEVVVESIAFAESTVDDADLPAGQTRVVTEGSPGERTITYRVTEIDGTETERSVVSDVVSTPPVDRVIANGTYVAPPPPPAPAPVAGSAGGGCDSNYAEACVPIDSDVDCAGGSGNGPSYFGGVARIVGTDVYDLDRDGDGYACEPS